MRKIRKNDVLLIKVRATGRASEETNSTVPVRPIFKDGSEGGCEFYVWTNSVVSNITEDEEIKVGDDVAWLHQKTATYRVLAVYGEFLFVVDPVGTCKPFTASLNEFKKV